MTTVPGLFRLGLADDMKSLRTQIEVAKTMGANAKQIFYNISFPQLVTGIARLSGFAAFWAVGDFALSRLISARTISVAMLVDDLLGSYRLSAASCLVLLLILLGACIYWLFRGLGNVLSQKSDTPL
jgi:ABC-type Fe3+ transport system permease subunit